MVPLYIASSIGCIYYYSNEDELIIANED
jgi:hypothetical protein